MYTANQWLAAMNAHGGSGYLGFNDWRFPDTLDPDPTCQVPDGAFGSGCRGSELGNLFYISLGGVAGNSITSIHDPITFALFSNIIANKYWSVPSITDPATFAYVFNFGDSLQGGTFKTNDTVRVWPVRSGDVTGANDDNDGDGITNNIDNCPNIANPGQIDADGDGIGDACDTDDDNDGVLDGTDNCPGVKNANQADTDSDNDGDACDTDDDNDGVPDTADIASLNPDICTDSDNDMCDDCVVGFDDFGPQADNFPFDDGTDSDLDGKCNVGDTDDDNDGLLDDEEAVKKTDPLNPDTDSDGKKDGADNCPLAANVDQKNTDGDADGDICDMDDDNDGVPDTGDKATLNPDICVDTDADLCDDCAIGTDNFGPLADNTPNNDGIDTDGDGQCDVGDPDSDNDGIPDTMDNCPVHSNAGQEDKDNDGAGDVCDACPDDAEDKCDGLCFPIKSLNGKAGIVCL